MSDSALTIRNKLNDFIRVAETTQWWKDHAFINELDQRYQSLENGTDKGFSISGLEASITKLRKKRNG